MARQLFIKPDRTFYPQMKDRYPAVYLEFGRLEVDDSSVKWINSEGLVVMLPAATLAAIFLGPGTSITHEALKTLASCNCTVLLTSQNCLSVYCQAVSPTADTRNMLMQFSAAFDPEKSLQTARRLFAFRFKDKDLSKSSLQEMMGIEGSRVRQLYRDKALQYGVSWKGRSYIPGKNEQSDPVNRMLTAFNSYLYGICTAVIVSMGFSPYVGYIHSGCPLPLVYDIADLYKESTSIDLAFMHAFDKDLTRRKIADLFIERCCELDILQQIQNDIKIIFADEKD